MSAIVRVADLMVRELRMIDGLATVEDAMREMRQHRVGSLVVRRRDADDEVGLLEVAGIAAAVTARNQPPARVHVYEAMTKPVVTLPAAMQARYAARLLQRLGLRRAVVVDEKRDAVGLVTLRNLVLGQAG